MPEVPGGDPSCEICSAFISICARLALAFSRSTQTLGDLVGSEDFATTWSHCQALKAEYIQIQEELQRHSMEVHAAGAELKFRVPQSELSAGQR